MDTSEMAGDSGQQPKIPIRQQHKQMTRQRLLDAGVQIFKERGYADATIDDIVGQAAMGRATFYLHFKSKLEVMRALIREIELCNEDMIRELECADSMDAAALKDWLERFIRQLTSRGDLFLVGLQALASEPELSKELETGLQMAHETLAAILRHRRGQSQAEAALRAQLLVSGLQRAVRLLVSDPHQYSVDLVVNVIAEIWTEALGLDS